MILYQNAVQNAFGPQAAEQAMEHLWKASKEEFLRYQRDLVAALSQKGRCVGAGRKWTQAVGIQSEAALDRSRTDRAHA